MIWIVFSLFQTSRSCAPIATLQKASCPRPSSKTTRTSTLAPRPTRASSAARPSKTRLTFTNTYGRCTKKSTRRTKFETQAARYSSHSQATRRRRSVRARTAGNTTFTQSTKKEERRQYIAHIQTNSHLFLLGNMHLYSYKLTLLW